MKIRIVLAILGLLVLFAGGLAIRRLVLEAQFERYGRDLPFDLESALEFRYVKMLFNGQSLPQIDRKIEAPDGIVVKETYTIGAEYVYAGLARLFPSAWSLPDRVRWIAAAWFCLGIPLLSLWLWWWLKSGWAAGIGGAFYALALAAVIRSTGQELSHENFALPLLIGHCACGALAATLSDRRRFALAALAAAVLLGLAVATWDMIQYYVLLWAALGCFRLVAGSYFREPRRRAQWMLNVAVLAATGLINPYCRAHGFPASYAMLLAYGAVLGLLVEKPLHKIAGPGWRGGLLIAGVAGLPLILGLFFVGTYGANYGHFMELLWAKIRFLNQKPADPAWLTFSQRMLWVPALDSANIRLTWTLFPCILPLFLPTFFIIVASQRWRSDPEIIQLLFYSIISLLVFILFKRFHVFCAIWFSVLLGWLAGWANLRRGMARWMVIPALICCAGIEAGNVAKDPVRWGSVPTYLRQKQELTQWLSDKVQDEPVLANFGISAYLLAYADCPIILHPKFESPAIRNRVRVYGELLFKSTEKRFRDWADSVGAKYYVYALGEFASEYPDQQMRYFVNALNPPPGAPARLFEYNPGAARYFLLLWGNSKYRLFRIITGADEQHAARLAAEAEAELARGGLTAAEDRAALALLYDPRLERAMKVILHVGSLREQGLK